MTKKRGTTTIKRDSDRIETTLRAAKIARLRKAGAKIKTIARLTNLTVYAVRREIDQSLDRVIHMRLDEGKLAERFPRPNGDAGLRKVAFIMRREGYTYDEIAYRLDISPSQAQRWVYIELQSIDTLELHDTAMLRAMSIAKLDYLETTLWNRIDNGDVKAIEALLKIEDRKSKLLGLDSPMRVNLENRIREEAKKNDLDADEMLAITAEVIEQHKQNLSD